jgi:CheY-like chemotaxis protein
LSEICHPVWPRALSIYFLSPAPLPEQIVAAVSRAGAFKTLEALLADDGFAGLLGKYLKTHNEAEFLAQLSPILYNTGRQALLAQVGAALSQTDDSHLPLIYVVDDSKVVLKMFEASLIPMGCRVKSFDNPFEAIEWVENQRLTYCSRTSTCPRSAASNWHLPCGATEASLTSRSLWSLPRGLVTISNKHCWPASTPSYRNRSPVKSFADAINQLTDFDVAPPP